MKLVYDNQFTISLFFFNYTLTETHPRHMQTTRPNPALWIWKRKAKAHSEKYMARTRPDVEFIACDSKYVAAFDVFNSGWSSHPRKSPPFRCKASNRIMWSRARQYSKLMIKSARLSPTISFFLWRIPTRGESKSFAIVHQGKLMAYYKKKGCSRWKIHSLYELICECSKAVLIRFH